ncbi:MAG: hypothetical protein HC897_13210 [Thermoanaerobaculia bacterium]|nr:hypothetical protein [Thermoanaerobaculia bacterium]
MLESARKVVVTIPKVPAHWLLSVGTVASFAWLLTQNRIHPIVIYLLEVYLTF